MPVERRLGDGAEHAPVDAGIPDDAALPDLGATRLELRLDEVEGPCASDVEPERVERVRELLAAPRDVGRGPLDRELRAVVDLLARLRVARDEPGEDERLRLRPALREPALDEQQVEPLLHRT